MSNVTHRDIEALIEIFDRSEWDELQIEMAGLKLQLSKNAPNGAAAANAALAPPTPASPLPAPPRQQQADASRAATPRAAATGNLVTVKAPNLGTFYRAPKPGAPPYVEIGQQVEADTDVCLLEVMKLFTAVCASVRGIVREVCVQDGEMVEGEQVLFMIEPRA
jgi:acetyl-CoA carboxylase biotin carboxyl carrier protein